MSDSIITVTLLIIRSLRLNEEHNPGFSPATTN